MKSKKFKYDGKSRPSNKLYKKNFDEIFGVKIKKDEEVPGIIIMVIKITLKLKY